MTAGPESVCWVCTTLLNTCDVKDVGYDKLMALQGRCLVKFQQICLRLLLTFCLLLLPLWESVNVLCFVVRYFMSILVLQAS